MHWLGPSLQGLALAGAQPLRGSAGAQPRAAREGGRQAQDPQA